MNKKKIIIISIVVILIGLLSFGIYSYFNKEDKNTTLTIVEKQWIESNKNNVIDLSIVNNIPIFNYNGKGVFFDFIDSLEKDTGLNFNKLSYEVGSDEISDYSFQIKNKIDKNDILVYEDNYVLITKEKVKYDKVTSIKAINIGVLSNEKERVNYYLKDNENFLYKPYKDITTLLEALDDTKNPVDGIVIPKTIYLKQIIENENFNISYNMTDMKKYYVLSLGNDEKLNNIIKKYYKKWYNEEYQESFNNNLTNDYFTFKQIYEQDKVNFRSKRYSYAFINYAPYDAMIGNRLLGTNYELIKGFAKLAGIEVSYDEYKNYDELVKAFNNNKIDFYLNNSSLNKYDLDVYNTVSAFNEDIAVISSIDKNITINSVSSLKGKTVITIKNSKIEKLLLDNDIDVSGYDNLDMLLSKKDKNDIIVIDAKSYNMYMYNKLKNYKVDYIFDLHNDYVYTCRDIENNKIFNEYFDFYLSFINSNEYNNNVKYDIFIERITDKKPLVITIIVMILAIIITLVVIIIKIKPKKKKETITKEDKLRYIDMLTSLKNRNYLNDSMEKWDSSDIYPQALVVIDLNNIAYINDNYGHEEGDNIIKEAASILIKTQVENTEIIRTNGNEFLIYMVGYQEKQVVTYIRKLNKELKDLNHGFGAAIGYSMIVDELKTIDDAINEATLDMKTNKEQIQN